MWHLSWRGWGAAPGCTEPDDREGTECLHLGTSMLWSVGVHYWDATDWVQPLRVWICGINKTYLIWKILPMLSIPQSDSFILLIHLFCGVDTATVLSYCGKHLEIFYLGHFFLMVLQQPEQEGHTFQTQWTGEHGWWNSNVECPTKASCVCGEVVEGCWVVGCHSHSGSMHRWACDQPVRWWWGLGWYCK